MEGKKLTGERVYYYNRIEKKYYKVIKSIALTDFYKEKIHFDCSLQECELVFDHSEVVSTDNKENDKECNTIYYYEIVNKNNNGRTIKHKTFICDVELIKNMVICLKKL
jgi:hypothetical protein